MRVGFVKSIAALLVGTGFAVAQGPAAMTGAAPRSAVSPRTDLSYPQSAVQAGYSGPVEVEHVPDSAFGGAHWADEADTPYRVYVDGDFLMWHLRNPGLPTLATSVPVGLVFVTQTDSFIGPGAGGAGTTNVTNRFSVPFSVSSNPSFPNNNAISLGDHDGGRLTLGAWFDADQDLGVELSAFYLEKLTNQFRNTTANTLNEFNLQTGLSDRTFFVAAGQAPQLTSQAMTVFPAQSTSEVFGSYSSELWGGEANVRCGGYRFGAFTFGGLAGVRYLHFDEILALSNDVRVTDAPQVPVGEGAPFLPITFQTFDRIRATNQIIAPQIGLETEGSCCGFFLNARAKVAVGPDFQEVHAEGFTTVVGSANPLTRTPGGLLTGPSDQGTFDKTRVCVVPEINLKLGYQCGSWLRLHVGYDALYMQHVVRASQQTSFTTLATTVSVANSTSTVDIRQPVINVRDLDVWVQGLNFGLELRY